jgi:hypothetical protein
MKQHRGRCRSSRSDPVVRLTGLLSSAHPSERQRRLCHSGPHRLCTHLCVYLSAPTPRPSTTQYKTHVCTRGYVVTARTHAHTHTHKRGILVTMCTAPPCSADDPKGEGRTAHPCTHTKRASAHLHTRAPRPTPQYPRETKLGLQSANPIHRRVCSTASYRRPCLRSSSRHSSMARPSW